MGIYQGSNFMIVARFGLLLFLIISSCIGLVAASAQLSFHDQWTMQILGRPCNENGWCGNPPMPCVCDPELTGSFSCQVACGLPKCMGKCIFNPLPGCAISCLVKNISCKSTCSIRPSPPPAPPAPTPPPPPPSVPAPVWS